MRIGRMPLLAAAAAAVTALSAGAAPAAQTGQDSPRQEQSFAAPGLTKRAEILIDQWGVPHIYAGTLYDAFYAQGFNAARDRLWQIDLWRRRGLGRLAEVFGPGYAEQDRAARLFLYRGDMYREWLAYGSDAKRVAEAFVAGINAYVAATRNDPSLLPPEFKILGYEPATWAPEDVVRIRSHGLTRNLTSEVERAQVACKAGLDTDELRKGLEPAWQASVPDGLDPCAVPGAVLDIYKLATREVPFSKERLNGAADPDGGAETRFAAADADIDPGTIGSNNWAISPAKSATGRPILANDPHRAHSVPSLRYIAHLSAPGVDVIGAGEPALPGISIGHNDRIAFGLTIFGIDQEDLYVYETNPANPEEYRYQGRWEPMRIVREDLPVKGREAGTIEMKFTRHGPVVLDDAQNHRAYAVRAAWLEPGMAPYFGSIDYMRARDWDQFLAAMNRWGSPSENQVYADTAGNIAWVPGGLTPIRPNWDGLLPVPGDGRYEWAGFYDRDALPSEFNPARGWVGSANQMNLPPDYPYRERKIGFEWTDPSRFNRITEVLSGLPKVGIEDSKRLQMDYASLHARRLQALLAPLQSQQQQQDGRTAAALKLLTGWDGVVGFDSPAAALYEVWFTRHLRPAVVAALAPKEVRPVIEGGDTAVLVALLEKPDQRFGADPAKARDAILLSSLGAAAAETENLLGQDWQAWRWSSLHKALFQHAISAVVDDATRPEFDVGPLAKAGDGYTVSASTYRTRDFRLTAGASFRMVVDVGNWDASWAVNTPGQSGDPRSVHYRDLAEKWVNGEYFPLLYSREAVEKAAERRIVLSPE